MVIAGGESAVWRVLRIRSSFEVHDALYLSLAYCK